MWHCFRRISVTLCLLAAAALAGGDYTAWAASESTVQETEVGKEKSEKVEQDESAETQSSTDAIAAKTHVLPGIVVTSQKREQRLMDVPVSIVHYSDMDLEDAEIRGVADLILDTPNIFARIPDGHDGYAFVNIRGIVSGNADFFSPTVGVFTDGMSINGGSEPMFFDLQSAEVLRGPQGTLYGGNTLGGAIVLTSQKPVMDWAERLSYAYESYNTHRVEGMVNVPLSDNAAFRLAGVFRHTDGFIDNETLDKRGTKGDQYALRGQVRFTPTDRWDINLNVNGYNKDSDYSMYNSLDSFDSSPWKTYSDELGHLEIHTFGQILTAKYTGRDIGFTSITGHREFSSKEDNDVDFTSADLITDHFKFENEQLTQELRLTSEDESSPLQWLVGLYGAYEQQKTEDHYVMHDGYLVQYMGAPAGMGDLTSVNLADVDVYNGAVFAQGTYALTHKLYATVGLRYDYVTKELSGAGDYTGAAAEAFGMPGRRDCSGRESYSALLPKFALEYRFTPDFNVYGSVTAGYKPGGFQTSNGYEADESYGAEHTWNYEIGTKGSFFDNMVDVNLSAFYIQMQDQQLYTLNSANTVVLSNAGRSHSLGAEAEVHVRPLRGLEVFGSYGYLKTRVDDAGESNASFDGAESSYSPTYQASLGGQYSFDCGVFARVENVFTGAYYLDSLNTTRQEGYSLLNAKIGYEYENYGVYLYAKNLLDEEYYNLAFDNDSAIPGQGMCGAMGAPRIFGLMVKAEF